MVRRGTGSAGSGVNGRVVVFAARPQDGVAAQALAGAFAALGMPLSVVVPQRCGRIRRGVRRSKVVVMDARGEVVLSRVLRACTPIDFGELIESVGG